MTSLIISAVRVLYNRFHKHDPRYVLAPVFPSTGNISIIGIRYYFQIIYEAIIAYLINQYVGKINI